MLMRAASSSILLIGGCSGGEEAGALRYIEEVVFQRREVGLEGRSRIVGQLKEPRRSPAVFRERDGVLVIGGCRAKGYHLSSAERIRWNDGQWKCEPLPQSSSTEGKSCAAFSSLDEPTGVIVGGFDGNDCLKTVDMVRLNGDKILPVRLMTARENLVCEVVFDRYIIVMAGWDGRRSLDSVEVFEIVDEHPYLVPITVDIKLCQARNRPASIVF
ncbi:kelch repeat protein [Ancylostoma duodenale]|uniref:Kelch repeat protein n=1 Tax=Ancylostoma duodenale TaxID=51022 RepID=A0A0C2H3C0_9BILA|nr:kelch repeat protein [Ancylostoma duodenale]